MLAFSPPQSRLRQRIYRPPLTSMTSISSIETVTPTPLPSLPNSPDTTHERSFLANSESGNVKGKQRAVDTEYDNFHDDEAASSPNSAAYPPTNNEAAETRQIEENLRRWETVERQRRKAARESAQSSPSLVSDVSRRASLLWSGNRSRHKNDNSLGNHVALQSQENISAVPLEDINATPTPSPSPSPTPSPRHRHSPDTENPFANPPEPLSPFADPHQRTALMSPSMDGSSAIPLPNKVPVDPIPSALPLAAPSSFTRAPPGPPMPLGLPPPRTPPPPADARPRSTSPPSLSRSANGVHDEPKETRWWHDWLCGCNEGPDRGGDYQAGRTNPFE